jgi:hypothetical protein
MNIYKKIFGSVILALGIVSFSNVSLAVDRGLSEEVTDVNAISVADAGTLDLGTVSNTGDTAGQNLTDFLTITMTSNTIEGYKITLLSANGFLQEAGGGTADGSRIVYTVACDKVADENSSTANVTAATLTSDDITGTAVMIQELSAPTAARHQQTANCDLGFDSDESVEDSFGGTYSDTLTFAITAYS